MAISHAAEGPSILFAAIPSFQGGKESHTVTRTQKYSKPLSLPEPCESLLCRYSAFRSTSRGLDIASLRREGRRVGHRGKQQIRDLVKRGLKNNLSIEQARDHRLVAEEANCWLLVSADHLRTPAKGWAEAVVREDRIEALSFRPLNEGAKDGLRALAGP